MIKLYSGTPGSGKSLHVMKDIVFKLQHGTNVIANFPVAIDRIKPLSRKKPLGKFMYVENDGLTSQFLKEFAIANHVKGKEAQTLIVIDEAQALFNPREFARKDRKDYCYFFTLHRHLGYNVTLVTQNDRLLDRQIRCLLEYEIKHRKVNNFKTIGMLLPFTTFIAVKYWYGVRERVDCEFFTYNKKLGSLYDSYTLFDLIKSEHGIEKKPPSSVDTFGGQGGPGCGNVARWQLFLSNVRKKFKIFNAAKVDQEFIKCLNVEKVEH